MTAATFDQAVVEEYLRDQYSGIFDEDQLHRHIEDYVGTKVAYELLDLVKSDLAGGARILDIGCGFGSFVRVASEAGLDAMGVDTAEFELRFAQARESRIGPTQGSKSAFLRADGTRLPFANQVFDLVTMWHVIEHVPSLQNLLAEAVRVLRPGGQLYILAPNYASVRREAHYHVPWLPLLPKRLGSAYLTRLGRDPDFLNHHIFYCTNWGTMRALKKTGMRIRDPKSAKITDPSLIASPRLRRMIERVRSLKLGWVLRMIRRITFMNPLKATIELRAEKNASH